IAHFLFQKSRTFLAGAEKHRKDAAKETQADRDRYDLLKSKSNPTEAEKAEMDEVFRRMEMRSAPPLMAESELPPAPKDQAAYIAEGRRLFAERGCLACHSHSALEQPGSKTANGLSLPAVKSEAHFGPNLSQIAAKLGDQPGDKKARRWLVQWILNPTVYHPRTFMPVTHLTPEQADQIAAWLLSNKDVPGPSEDVAKTLAQKPTTETLKELAKVYLRKVLTQR